MNKAELINVLADKLGHSRAEVERFVNGFTDVITDNLKQGEKVTLVGFGTFSVSERAARVGRNPPRGTSRLPTRAMDHDGSPQSAANERRCP